MTFVDSTFCYGKKLPNDVTIHIKIVGIVIDR